MAKKPQIFKCDSKRIISIGEEETSSEIFMSIKFCLLDTLDNLNDINYSPAFLQEVADNPQKYLSLPLMAEFNKLAQGKTENLTHAFNKKTNKFSSQMIGSFISFETQPNSDDETITELIGEARVPKRFEDICTVLQELFDEGNLTLSYEIAVSEFKQVGKIKYVDAAEGNYLFAMAVVTSPAVLSAHSLTLVAQIIESNQNIEGGEQKEMQRNKDFSQEEMFKNAKVTLIAELDMNQIQRKIYHALKSFIVDDWYDYDVVDQSMTYIIIKKWSDGDFYKVDYTVSETDVSLSNMRKVTKKYEDIPEEEDTVTIAELELQVANLKIEVASKDATIKEKESLIAEKETALTSKETELAEVNTKLTTVSENLLTKTTELAELLPVKEAHEAMLAEKATAELAEKKTALKEKFSKVLSAEVMVEMAEALENLDVAKLNEKVVEIAMSVTPTTKPKVETASRITDNVSMGKNDLVSKYITINE